MESDRVTHPLGFSLIAPKEWQVYITESQLQLESEKLRSSVGVSITVRKLEVAPFIPGGWNETTVAASTYWEGVSNSERNQVVVMTRYVKTADNWYQISVRIPQALSSSETTRMFHEYLSTFRT
jgi:hypothetical protein